MCYFTVDDSFARPLLTRSLSKKKTFFTVDMESIDALVEAVKDFKGGLIVVSHDQYFITNTCSELWVVGEGKATRFRGDFDDYKKDTMERTARRVAASVKSLSTINN